MDAITLTAPVRHSNAPCRCSETLICFNQHGLPHSFASREFFSLTRLPAGTALGTLGAL